MEITRNLQTFVNRCLRRILRIWWPNKISNKELWEKTNEEEIELQIKRRKWGWIGHSLRKDRAIEKEVLRRNSQGKRKIGRPKTTWRRTTEEELKRIGKSWTEVGQLAQNRRRWREFVKALCSSGRYRN